MEAPVATTSPIYQFGEFTLDIRKGCLSKGTEEIRLRPKVFETLNDVKSALQDKQIAAFVTDTPTAQYISSSEIPGTIMVAQFPSTGEHYGLLFAKGNPLVGCVNKALATLTSNGTLAQLATEFLQIYTSVPTIQP